MLPVKGGVGGGHMEQQPTPQARLTLVTWHVSTPLSLSPLWQCGDGVHGSGRVEPALTPEQQPEHCQLRDGGQCDVS